MRALRGNSKRSGITPMTVVGAPSIVMERPTMPGSLPNRRAHSACASTTTRATDIPSSPGRNTRPSTGRAPSTSNAAGSAVAPITRSAEGSPASTNSEYVNPASVAERTRARSSARSAGATPLIARESLARDDDTTTRRPASGSESGRSAMPLTTAKSALADAIPMASVATRATLWPGAARRRAAMWRTRRMVSVMTTVWRRPPRRWWN